MIGLGWKAKTLLAVFGLAYLLNHGYTSSSTEVQILAAESDEKSEEVTIQQVPGQSGTGLILSESGGKLVLNTDPCSEEVRVVIFVPEYRKEPLSEPIVCKKRKTEYHGHRVVQLNYAPPDFF